MESIDYKCKICNKHYKTYQTLWKHNKKFHDNNATETKHHISLNTVIDKPNDQSKKIQLYKCQYCNNNYKHFQSRWKHEQKCKIKNNNIIELNKLKESKEIKKLELELKKEETTILRLKLKLEKSNKADNITLNKLNKMLMERNNKIKNSFNTVNNQQIINNFHLVGFGKEEVIETLTNRDKKLIMNARYNSLDKLIEIIHCGKYNQFKNIIITNMKDNYMYKYDDKLGRFILSTKADVLNSLIDYRLDDLEIIYNDLIEKNKLDNNTKDIIEKFINKINYIDTKYTDYDGKEHENYKQYKINEIKVLLFNNQDKITSDISLLLTTNEVTTDLII